MTGLVMTDDGAFMIDEPPFWVIWNPDHPTSPDAPPKRFKRRGQAQAAARAMAKECAGRGEVVYVLKAQSCHQQQVAMADFYMAEFGIGAPCPYHHPKAERAARYS